ncbi:MAG: BRO family protein [Desulfobacteraceae bacterium]
MPAQLEQLSRREGITATVTRLLSDKINEKAAPGDLVSGRQLEMRVHRQGIPKITDRDNKPDSDTDSEGPKVIPLVDDVIPPRANPSKVIVNESGLYCLIIRSDKPQAKPFRKWVTSEVLPSIRKTGSHPPFSFTTSY